MDINMDTFTLEFVYVNLYNLPYLRFGWFG